MLKVITDPFCGPCKIAKAALDSSGIEYTEEERTEPIPVPQFLYKGKSFEGWFGSIERLKEWMDD